MISECIYHNLNEIKCVVIDTQHTVWGWGGGGGSYHSFACGRYIVGMKYFATTTSFYLFIYIYIYIYSICPKFIEGQCCVRKFHKSQKQTVHPGHSKHSLPLFFLNIFGAQPGLLSLVASTHTALIDTRTLYNTRGGRQSNFFGICMGCLLDSCSVCLSEWKNSF